MADPNMEVKVTADTGGAVSDVDNLRKSVENLNNSVEGIKKSLDGFKERIAELFTYEAVAKFTEHMERLGNEVVNLSAQLGNTKDQAAELIGVFEIIGAKGLESGRQMVVFQRNIAAAIQDPASRQAQALHNIGISTDELKSKQNDSIGILMRLREAWQEYGDGLNKTTNFQAIMGLSLASTIPLFTKTDEQIEAIRSRLVQYNEIIARSAVGMVETGEKLHELGTAVESMGVTWFNALKPVFDWLFDTLTAVVIAIRDWGLKASDSFDGLLDPLIQLGHLFSDLGGIINDTLSIGLTLLAALLGKTTEEVKKSVTEYNYLKDIINTLSGMFSLLITPVTGAVAAIRMLFLVLKVSIEETIQGITLAINALRIISRTDISWAQKGDLLAKEWGDSTDKMKKFWADGLHDMQTSLNNFVKDATTAMANLMYGAGKTVAEDFSKLAGPQGRGAPTSPKPTPPPPPRTGQRHHGEVEDFMKEWTQALHEQEIKNNDFFEKSKNTELAYWTEKKAWTVANHNEIIAIYEKAGLTLDQANKKYKDLIFSEDEKLFQLQKGLANQNAQEFKAGIDERLKDVKAEYDQHVISESEWLEKSKAIMQEYLVYLRSVGAEGTKIWDAAIRQQNSLDREHAKNIMEIYKGVFDFLDSGFKKLTDGFLTGGKTLTQSLQGFFKDMASSFISYVAKMIVQWLLFEAVVHTLGADVAKSMGVGSPFAKVLDAIKAAFGTLAGKTVSGIASGVVATAGKAITGGVGNAVAGGAAQAGTDKAMTALTAAVAKDTTSTLANSAATHSLTGGVFQWIGQQIESIAEALGLTTATTAQTLSTDAQTLIQAEQQEVTITLIGSIVSLQGAVDALTIAMAAKAAMPLAVGAWNVPQDMHAYIHKGEMVVPASAAASLRDGAGMNFNQGKATQSSAGSGGSGGGGGDTHIYIHAVDAKSFQSMVNGNSHLLVNALGLAARNGTRPGAR